MAVLLEAFLFFAWHLESIQRVSLPTGGKMDLFSQFCSNAGL